MTHSSRYTYIIGKYKSCKPYTKPLHSLCISLILRALHCVGFELKILHNAYIEPYTEPYILENELNMNFEEGREKFEEGKEKFEEGKLKFEEGKLKFEEGKLKFEEGKF